MGSRARAAHGAFAAAGALLATTAIATLDIPDKKLHLKATPLLFYAVPVSLPLPPLEPLPNLFPRNELAPTPPSYESSPFSLAQGATGAVSSLSRRAISHLLPVYLATSVTSPAAASVLYPRGYAVASPPVLAQNSFSTSGLYTWKHSANSVTYFESLLSSFQKSKFTESLHTWHAPRGQVERKPALTVVLLGWLGAQQKHLKKYAEWYNARGIHAVTFVIPMADILSFQVERNADEHVESLARHLAHWLSEHQDDAESEKQLLFHTFSNTGWLTYGVMLEKMQEQGDFVGRIKGCVIDSAPVPNPDPQVWASGFSAALLKKRSSAIKPALSAGELKEGVSAAAASQGALANLELGGANGLETALHSVLQGFFSFFLKLPAINQRLSEVVTVLQKKQPPCPQLYMYSSADKVIPVKYVEAFIEDQRRSGRVVRACNLQSSPHVDHFRSHPQLYSEQLSEFLNEILPSSHYHAAI